MAVLHEARMLITRIKSQAKNSYSSPGLQFIGYPHAQILYGYSHSGYSKAPCSSCTQVATGLAIVQG
jgi:hypothetical protein